MRPVQTHLSEALAALRPVPPLDVVLADAAANLERVADHCSNVAAALIETALGSMDLHDYTEHAGESAEFREQYRKDRAEYALPAARR